MAENGARGTVSYAGLKIGSGSRSGSRGTVGNTPHPDITAVGLGTNARRLDPYSYDSIFGGFGDYYGEGDRQAFVDRVRNEGQRQRESARTREQQEENYAYQNWNLAQDNPRGNLNQMSYGDTLRYSRLADMVNNKFHYRPGNKNLIGTGKKGIMQQADSATVSRWDPIETEEMRQMKANRELDMRARQAGVDLQSRIQAYPQDVQEALDESTRKMQEFISQQDVQFIQNALMYKLQTEYGGSWQAMFEMMVSRFNKEMELEVGKRIWDAARFLTPDWMYAFITAMGRHTPVPDLFQQAFNLGQQRTYEALVATGIPSEIAGYVTFNVMPAGIEKMTAEIARSNYEGNESIPGYEWGTMNGNPQDYRGGR